jgi:crossover junction endodeoxyribonuclease RuvC
VRRSRLICGIDPGATGAVSAIRISPDHPPIFIDVHDLPTLSTAQGKAQPDAQALAALIIFHDPDLLIIESVNAMPSTPGKNGQRRSMGATSAFNFGHGAGMILATAQLSKVPLTLVLPRTWKARAKLTRKPKDYSRTLALQHFPDAPLHRIKDHGRADALLIALYGAQEGY